jgi:hypothetical protein
MYSFSFKTRKHIKKSRVTIIVISKQNQRDIWQFLKSSAVPIRVSIKPTMPKNAPRNSRNCPLKVPKHEILGHDFCAPSYPILSTDTGIRKNVNVIFLFDFLLCFIDVFFTTHMLSMSIVSYIFKPRKKIIFCRFWSQIYVFR